jgi:D-3-phosphoglycerate dehydrogenase
MVYRNKTSAQDEEVCMSFKVTMVVAQERLPKDLFACIAATGADVSMYKSAGTEDELLSICGDADYIITFQGYFPFTPRVLKGLSKCRFLQTLGIGYDALDVKVANEQGIGIINLQGFCVEELAEHAMALILTSARWIMVLHHRVRIGKTVPPANDEAEHHMSILKGKTLGIIGFGNSGRALVPKARGFEMRILAYDPYVNRGIFKEKKVEPVSLDRLLEESDFISIHANLTPENRHLIGPEQFKKMKRNVFIINTARGGLIDEPALCDTLAHGNIAGAGLDVTDQEPVPLDSPLLKFDNVILTGHNAGTSPESKARAATQPAEELSRVMRGEWPLGLVNPEVKEKFMAKWGRMREPG